MLSDRNFEVVITSSAYILTGFFDFLDLGPSQMMEDFELKLEIEDPIKLEQFEPDISPPDNDLDDLDYETYVKKILGVKSEDFVGCTESDEKTDRPETRAVLEELKNNDVSEDLLDFEREIPEFYVKQGRCEVKLETDELVIKSETDQPEFYVNQRRCEVKMKVDELAIKQATERTAIILQSNERLEKDQPDKPFKCPLCRYGTMLKFRLKNHMLIHMEASAVEMFSCQLCSFKSRHKVSLTKHVFEKHTDDTTKYRCDQCSYQSKKADSLQRHVASYHGDAPAKALKCDRCDYRTTKRSSFKAHWLVHMDPTKVEMFSCPFCDVRFRRKGAIRRHLRATHSSGEHKCRWCPYQTKSEQSLKIHVRAMHTEDGASLIAYINNYKKNI